jgi:hypothetical protein
MNRSIALGASLTFLLIAGCGGDPAGTGGTAAAADRMAPRFEVDPLWPKPLPNGWILGSTIGVSVDSRDHVWIIHRDGSLNAQTEASAGINTPEGQCCSAAPPVLEFDPEGNLVSYWGGPGDGYEWPQSNHGITVDHMDNIWIGGNGANDAHLLKFTRSGEFLMQLGNSGANNGSNDRVNFGRVAKISVDPEASEAFIADGYLNKRVVVVDMTTGEFKRYWGAYGNMPDDTDLGNYDPDAPPAPQFRNPVHCAEPSNDGLVYVCDRVNNRIQVFDKNVVGAPCSNPGGVPGVCGFLGEAFVAIDTLGNGSTWDLDTSADKKQSCLINPDGTNQKVWILERDSLAILGSFGEGGRSAGQFHWVHNLAVDSKGNLYTAEVDTGKRAQKFEPKKGHKDCKAK